MRSAEECLTAGGPWTLEEIENITGYVSMKDWQLGEQQAEIKRLEIRISNGIDGIEDMPNEIRYLNTEIKRLKWELKVAGVTNDE